MQVYNPKNYSYITVVEIPKTEISNIDFATCGEPTKTLKAYYDSCKEKPTILMNGGLFNMSTGKPILNFIDDGDPKSRDYVKAKTGFAVIDGALTYGDCTKKVYKEFLSGYPTLLVGGNKTALDCGQELNYAARRSVLGYNDKNVYLIVIGTPGMKFEAMQDFLLNMGITYAINLDGGGSSKILKDGVSITSTSYNRAVDNVVAVYLKPEPVKETKPITTAPAQTPSTDAKFEAFYAMFKKAADQYYAELKALPPTFGKASTDKIEAKKYLEGALEAKAPMTREQFAYTMDKMGYLGTPAATPTPTPAPTPAPTITKVIYKVQAGAFSSKANATNYCNKIKALKDSIGAGYKNAYVTFEKNLYKVQVGAFSSKDNATKVANDLKAKGFSSFVTQ